MSKIRLILLALLLSTASATAQSLADLEWLAGGWTSDEKAAEMTQEHWTPPAGSKMFGVNRSFAQGQVHGYEHLVIEERSDGLVYLAMPDGRMPAVEFRLTQCRPGLAVFENPEHDFPQKIVYQRLDSTTIRATVSGGEARLQWTMRKFP